MAQWRRRLAAGRSPSIAALVMACLLVIGAGCSGSPPETTTAPTDPPATTVGAAGAAGAGDAAPVELDVEIDATTTTAPPGPAWKIGGTVIATGPLAGTFDFAPLCDVRNDAEGEFLNVAFGYENLEDPIRPTVRVVVHVREWRGEGDFETTLEAQYQTGTGFDLSFADGVGTAQLTLALIDKEAGADVLSITLQGDFDGAVTGTVDAELVCYAG